VHKTPFFLFSTAEHALFWGFGGLKFNPKNARAAETLFIVIPS